MSIYDKVLSLDVFRNKPPVLLDIGASSRIHEKWRKIAKYCVVIAFEPNKELTEYASKETGYFKKLYVFPAIVHGEAIRECDFYLTRSKECSSTLVPDDEALAPWHFRPFYDVIEKVSFPSVTLDDALAELNISHIDWFKTDSQGTDLRIFKNLKDKIRKKVVCAEFEPGIIDAYHGEDKLSALLSYMDGEGKFWMVDCHIHGSQYFNGELARKYLAAWQRRLIPSVIKTSPGWAEVCYLNRFSSPAGMEIREYLLGVIFAMINEQYGFALELTVNGEARFKEPIFTELKSAVLKKIPWIGTAMKKVIRKFILYKRSNFKSI